MAYELGAIWLQVIPSFDGVHDGARKAGEKWAKESHEGYDAKEKQLRGEREKNAKEAGAKAGKAESDARVSEVRKGHEKVSQLEEEHQRKLRAADRDHVRQRERLRRQHTERLREEAGRGDKRIEATSRQHHKRMEDFEQAHIDSREKMRRGHLRKLEELEARGSKEAADARLRAQQGMDKAEERSLRASERRQRQHHERLRRTLAGQAKDDPTGFQRQARERLSAATKDMPDIEIGLDSTKAEEELMALKAKMEALGRVDIGVDMDADRFAAEYASVMARMAALDARKADIRVDADTARAHAKLAGLAAAATATEGSLRGVGRGVDDAGNSAGSAANAFRAMNGVLMAAVTIGPVLIPMLLGVAGALASIATFSLAAVGAIGVGAVGLRGIGDAVGAMGDLDAERAKPSAQRSRRQGARQVRNAARSVRNARRGVDNARDQAADGNTRAIERQERAERSLSRAQDDARRAQDRLTRARADAQRQIEDMNNALLSGALAERDALYNLEEARYELFRIMQDGSATQREKDRAQLTYDIQVQSYRELQLDNTRQREDKARVDDAGGASGLDSVISAERGVEDAARAVTDAQREVADAAKNRADAQVEGAERIRDAEERLQDALENQRDVLADVALGVGAVATAQDKLREALAKLSPEAREFATWLHGLRPMLENLQWSATRDFLPGLQEGLQAIVDTYGDTAQGREARTGGPSMHDYLHEMGELLGDISREWGKWATKPEIIEFFELLGDYSLVFIRQFGDMMPGFFEGIFGVITALLPFTEQFGDALLNLSEVFSEWANSEAGQETMANFFDYLANMSPEVMELFVAALRALTAVIIALAPWTEFLIDEILTPLLEWMADADPDVLRGVVLGIMAAVFAFQLLAGTVALVQTTMGLFKSIQWLGGGFGKMLSLFGIGGKANATAAAAGTLGKGKMAARGLMRFGAIGLAIGAVILGLFLLYEHSEGFRDFVDGIVDVLVTAWRDYIWPALQAIYDFLAGILGPVFKWLYEEIVKPVWDLIVLAINIAWAAIEIAFKLLQVGIEVVGAIFTWLYEEIIKPVWEGGIKPVLQAFGNFFMDHVYPVIEAAVGAIGGVWESLQKLFAMPIVFIVDTIINDGIIGTLNKVFDFFDISPVGEVSVPAGIRRAANQPWGGTQINSASRGGGRGAQMAMASGGILPGYSPGMDIHNFVSPTGGRLRLSGGEAIMRPEVARVLGEKGVNALNSAAIRGGTAEVARVLGPTLPDGAVPDWLANAASGVWDGITTAAEWVGDIASYAWDFVTDPVGSLKGVVGDIIDKGSDWSDSSIAGKMVFGVPMNLIDRAGDAIGEMLGIGGADSAKGYSGPMTSTGGNIYGAQPWANVAARSIAAAVGRPSMMMQAFNQSMAGDHPQGLAVDFIDQRHILDQVARYATANASELGLRYLAWQGRMFTPAGGWRPQTVGYGNDPMHRWHVHVSFNRGPGGAAEGPDPIAQIRAKGPQLRDGGGVIEPGLNYILNATGEKEWGLTRQQLDNLRGPGGGGGDTIFDIDIDRPGATAGEIAEELNFQLRKARRGGAYVG